MVLTKRSAASGDENELLVSSFLCQTKSLVKSPGYSVRFKMAAVLTEPRLQKESTNEMPEDDDDEVEDLQEANEVSSSKKKRKKKKKKKGQFSLMVKRLEELT